MRTFLVVVCLAIISTRAFAIRKEKDIPTKALEKIQQELAEANQVEKQRILLAAKLSDERRSVDPDRAAIARDEARLC